MNIYTIIHNARAVGWKRPRPVTLFKFASDLEDAKRQARATLYRDSYDDISFKMAVWQ